MGIENFHSWLKENYSKCFSNSYTKNRFDYIYIDINHILHNSMNGIRKEAEFIERLYNSLDLVFSNYLAVKRVIIAIDGTSPHSKILLQRKRRSMGIKKLDVNKLSSIYLTPGTDFIARIDVYIQEYIQKMQSMYQYIDVKFEYIPSSIPDEGEIKIFNKKLEHGRNDPFNSHLVIGNDADLVVLAVALNRISNIHILIRHNKSIELLSVDKLIAMFCSKIPTLIISKEEWKADFTLISLMLGNDYLPKLKYIKYNSIWKSYFETIKKTKQSIVLKNKLNNEPIKVFFKTIIENIKYQKFNPKNYEEDQVVNYLEGLLWCMNMYQTGECSMYDYTYNHKTAPAPTDIYHFLDTSKKSIAIPKSNHPQ